MKRGTPSHPKTAALAELLGLERWGAVGVLESLWHFAGQYARRGDLGRHKNLAIARGIDWRGDADKLVAALVDAGWVDECPCHRLRIHDWKDHADQAVSRTKDVLGAGFLECYSNPLEKTSKQLAAVQTPPASGFRLPASGTGLPATGRSAASADATLASSKVEAMASSNPEREEFIREVWSAWCVKRGGELPGPSSAEGDLMRALYEDGIPLRVALRGISDCSKPPRGVRTPMEYARGAFDDAARHWRRSAAL